MPTSNVNKHTHKNLLNITSSQHTGIVNLVGQALSLSVSHIKDPKPALLQYQVGHGTEAGRKAAMDVALALADSGPSRLLAELGADTKWFRMHGDKVRLMSWEKNVSTDRKGVCACFPVQASECCTSHKTHIVNS